MNRLDQIERRLELATPGEWTEPGQYGTDRWEAQGAGRRLAVVDRVEDARLFAHAPADLAVLLRLARAVERWRQTRNRYLAAARDLTDYAISLNDLRESERQLEAALAAARGESDD